ELVLATIGFLSGSLRALSFSKRIAERCFERLSLFDLGLERAGALLEHGDFTQARFGIGAARIALRRVHSAIGVADLPERLRVRLLVEVSHRVRADEGKGVRLAELIEVVFEDNGALRISAVRQDIDHLGIETDRRRFAPPGALARSIDQAAEVRAKAI